MVEHFFGIYFRSPILKCEEKGACISYAYDFNEKGFEYCSCFDNCQESGDCCSDVEDFNRDKNCPVYNHSLSCDSCPKIKVVKTHEKNSSREYCRCEWKEEGTYNDYCIEAQEKCSESSSAKRFESGSCKNKCGLFDVVSRKEVAESCFCDPTCLKRGDCCHDYRYQCKGQEEDRERRRICKCNIPVYNLSYCTSRPANS